VNDLDVVLDGDCGADLCQRLARETLEASGQISILSQVQERARSLPPNLLYGVERQAGIAVIR
jgi:hypothetical protein